MKYLYLSIALILSFPLFSNAQSNYKSGYTVSLKGDTLKGFIDYREWAKNPENINFRYNLTSPIKNLSPDSIQSFAVNGLEYYQSKEVSISSDETELNKLSHTLDTSAITARVFLKTITTGKNVSLYVYEDNLKVRYYINDNTNNQISELGYHLYYNSDNSSAVIKQKQYRGQLSALAQKFGVSSSLLNHKIDIADYRESDLLSIALVINEASDKDVKSGNTGNQFVAENSSATRLFLGVGVTDNKISFQNPNVALPDKSSLFPKLSAGLDLIPNKSTQSIIFRAELMLSADKYNLSAIHTTFSSSQTQSLNISQYNVGVVPQIIWNLYRAEALKVFIDAGANINYSTYNDYKLITNYDNLSTLSQDKYPQFNKVAVSFLIKVGVVINQNIEIYGGFSPASIASDDYAKITSYQAGINYLFGIK
jgi:hypothetical protein